MGKIQRITGLQYKFSLFNFSEDFDTYYNRFLESDLGKIYLGIPWNDLVESFELEESSKGPDSFFSPRGKLGLMFLKNYSQVSDKKLIEQLNSNIDYQFFCDMNLGFNRLENYKIVSQIRCELAENLNIEEHEKVLASHWSEYINNKSSAFTDATCYESEVRYPTDQKLLWEAVDWSYNQMRKICNHLEIKTPRTKYLKWKRRNLGYSKMRRKTKSKRRTLTRSLLHLLNKINVELDKIELRYSFEMPNLYDVRRETISKIYEQQEYHFTTGEHPKNRIVSISKNYLRPIVRGKEIKKVEFGAKVNKLQIDGINFIQRISFDAFNEGTELENTVYKAQQLTKIKIKTLGADAIYATNKNRNFISKHKINTDFRPKGKKSKDYKIQQKARAIISKERATRLEGSFGKDKEHYHLKKVKAKTPQTEKLWIFFGIHVANALEIGRRITESQLQKSA
jgi:hypothetical protein